MSCGLPKEFAADDRQDDDLRKRVDEALATMTVSEIRQLIAELEAALGVAE